MTELEAAAYWLDWIKLGKNIGAFAVAVGVAAEFLGDFLAKPYEDKIEAARKVELAQLHKDADEAKARAKEAELALEKYKAPRIIEKDKFDELVEKLKPFSGRRIDIFAYPTGGTPDTLWYANRIFVAFLNARWKVKFWSVIGGAADAPEEVGVSGLAGIGGDAIFKMKLIDLLKSAGIEAHPWRTFIETDKPSLLEYGPSWDSADVAPIRILVGSKAMSPAASGNLIIQGR